MFSLGLPYVLIVIIVSRLGCRVAVFPTKLCNSCYIYVRYYICGCHRTEGLIVTFPGYHLFTCLFEKFGSLDYAEKVKSLANQYGESVHLSLVPTRGFGNKPAQLLCNRD